VIKISRKHETRGQRILLLAVFRDWEVIDAQEKLVDEWRSRRDQEFIRRSETLFQEKAKAKGYDVDKLGSVEDHPKFQEWLETNQPPWRSRWYSSMHDLYKEACQWWRFSQREKASFLPEGWTPPRPPSSKDIAQLFTMTHEIKVQELAGASAEKLISLRSKIPAPPQGRVNLVIWWLRRKWRESHPKQADEADSKPIEFLNQWWVNHNRAKATAPPKDWVCPEPPPPEELLDGSKHIPDYEDAEQAANPPEWVDWYSRHPCPKGAFFLEMENDERAEDDTELLAWCAQRDIALKGCRWEQIEEPMPARKDVLGDWLEDPANHPPDLDDPAVTPQEEPVVVPLFACDSDEEAKAWLEKTGKRL